jgi:hypothetical protein
VEVDGAAGLVFGGFAVRDAHAIGEATTPGDLGQAPARTPALSLALPLRRRQRRSAGAKSRKALGPP